jgi:hypothetical protein
LNLASQNFDVQVTFESNSQAQLLPFLMLAAFVFGLSVAVLALLIHKERNLKGDRLSASSFNCNCSRKVVEDSLSDSSNRPATNNFLNSAEATTDIVNINASYEPQSTAMSWFG